MTVIANDVKRFNTSLYASKSINASVQSLIFSIKQGDEMNIQSAIKTFIVLLAIFLFLALPGRTLAGSESGSLTPLFSSGTATINTGALNVRSGPGVGYSSVAVVYKNQTVNLLGRNADSSWLKVSLYNGVEGWVNATLVNPSVAISSLTVLVSTSTAHVAAGNLNVRSGPGATYASVAVAHNGDSLVLIGRNSAATWVKVRLANGTEGWVNVTLVATTISIASLPVLDTGPASSEPTATVATGALNIRSGASSAYGIVATLSQGQTVVLLGRTADTGWAKVRVYNGAIGWANGAYLNASVAFSSLPVVSGGSSTPPPTPSPTGATGSVTANALNVRSGPGIGYWVVTGVYWGQHVTVVGRSADGGWLKITVGGFTGWASSSFIQTSVPFYELAIVS
jgi:uncharacterized protein YraI